MKHDARFIHWARSCSFLSAASSALAMLPPFPPPAEQKDAELERMRGQVDTAEAQAAKVALALGGGILHCRRGLYLGNKCGGAGGALVAESLAAASMPPVLTCTLPSAISCAVSWPLPPC